MLFRSLIFVPGNNPRFIAKVSSLKADVICIDLEDSVPVQQKDTARHIIHDTVRDSSRPLFVRTNSPDSGMIMQDMEATVPAGLAGLVVPKVNTAADLEYILQNIGGMEPPGHHTLLIPSIESAAGVMNTYSIASADPRVCCVMFGIFDLLHDMGMEYSKDASTASYARSKIPLDAAAAGIPAIDGIWQDIPDVDGFQRDCRLGRSMGYAGKSLIHPNQIADTHDIFAPTDAEIQWARQVRDVYHTSSSSGRGAVSIEGKMVDEVHYKRAIALLTLIGE